MTPRERRRFLSVVAVTLVLALTACATTVSPTPLSTQEPEAPSAEPAALAVDVVAEDGYSGGMSACVQFWNTMSGLRKGDPMDLALHMTLLEIQDKASDAEPPIRSAAAVMVSGSAGGEINILENGANGMTDICLELNYLP